MFWSIKLRYSKMANSEEKSFASMYLVMPNYVITKDAGKTPVSHTFVFTDPVEMIIA